jgi:ABC-type phosphate/phosphonate transport system substrate-binding protein
MAMVPASRADAAEPETKPLKIGLGANLFNGLPTSVAGQAATPFQAMFEKQTGLKGQIEISKDYAELTAKLRNGTLDVAVLHGFEYSWVKHHKEFVPLLVAVPANKPQACLVVNTNSKAKAAAELKGNCVAIPGTTKAHCHLYIDRLKCTLPNGCCGTAKLDGTSVEEALDAVARGDCEAALVDAGALLSYQKSKPGVGTNLKVLCESDPFPPAVIVYRKEAFDAKTVKKVSDSFLKGFNSPQGQLLAGLWRLKSFSEVTDAYQTELDKCLKAFPPPKEK